MDPAVGESGKAVVKIALEEGEATIDDCRGGILVLGAGQSIELAWDPSEPCASP
jgi:hypothetical protein